MRPAVDVVIPFAGSDHELAVLRRRLEDLELGPGDTLTVAHNSSRSGQVPEGVVNAAGQRSSYFARNVGAARGANPWICFLDADVSPDPGLLGAYFEPEPAEATGCLVGGLADEAPAPGAPAAVRYAHRKGHMSDTAIDLPRTANCLVRRAAFESVGGFADGIRSGGDADLWLRLKAAGWELERRPPAGAVHLSRDSLPALARQIVRHGAGSAWVERRHPGAFPKRGRLGLARWSAGRLASAVAALAGGRREESLDAALDGVLVWADEMGRLLPNRAPRG